MDATDQRDVADVVPDVGEVLVRRDGQSPLEARQRHVVLLRVEAAQAKVVVQLSVVHAHLEEPPARIKQYALLRLPLTI